MKIINTLLFGLTLSISAMATSITLTDPYGPNTSGDVIGDKAKFDIQSLTISDTSKVVTVNALLNYGGGTSMNSFYGGSATFNNLYIGDVLFSLGGAYTYAIILHGHDGLVAGNLYQLTQGAKTAFDLYGVVDPTQQTYRANAAVWANAAGATKVNSVNGTSSATLVGGGPEISATVSFSLANVNTSFLTDYGKATTGISFASATCGNDVIGTPEPASMAMMGAGMVALALLRRRKSTN